MFNRLLVPLDGSPLAEQAVGQAMAISRACGASVDLLFVHEPGPFENVRSDAPGGGEWATQAERYLKALGEELGTSTGARVTHTVLQGDPARVICDRAADVDLIVMTSHGRTGLSRAWLGSVADAVMRHAKTPVLILRPLGGATAHRGEAHQVFKHILIPLDGLSTEIVPPAIALAKCGNARVTLLRIVQPLPQIAVDASVPYLAVSGALDPSATKEISDAAREQIAGIARRLHDDTGLETTSRVIVDSQVATSILAFAEANEIDVIAMSSHTGAVSRLFLGSVADKVARGSEVPVLVYKPA
jgi:nucleotide-binding universal stress UspA family protein